MPALNAEGSREHTDIAFHSWSDEQGPDAALNEALAAVGASEAKLVALDETMRADFALLLLGALPDAKHTFLADTVGALRMRKDAAEFAALKANAGIADRAMQAAFANLRPDISENELAEIIKAEFGAAGAAPAFWIVGGGPNGAFPHHHASERRFQEGDAVVIDIGGRKGGYPSDITRMAVVGRPPEGYGQIHTIVERAVQAAVKAARPGVKAKEVDAAARRVIARRRLRRIFRPSHRPRPRRRHPRAALHHRDVGDGAGGGHGVLHRARHLSARPVWPQARGDRHFTRGRRGDSFLAAARSPCREV